MRMKLFMATRIDYIFLDTSFIKGVFDPKDDFHIKASKFWGQFQKDGEWFLITNFILDEMFTLVRKRCGKDLVSLIRQELGKTKKLQFVRVGLNDEKSAWQWFFNDWSDLSYTDCTSFAVMKRLGLSRVATFDEHFSRAGFKVVK